MKLNIGYVFDEGFSECSAVSMMSIMINHKNVDEITFWIMDDGIASESKDKIKSMVNSLGRQVFFVDATVLSKKFEELGVEPWRGKYSAYMKLFISEYGLSEEIKRFLLIDGDTIINEDITDLFTMDLNGHPCAMGLECVPGDYYFASGLGAHELYNAGVIVYDVQEWEKRNIEGKVIDYIKENGGHYMLPEEDIISRILMDDIEILFPEYNFLTLFEIYNTRKYFKRVMWDKLEGHVNSIQSLENAKKKVKIYHCIDSCTNRPWHENNCHPYTQMYDRYRKMTPWCNEKKITKDMSLWHKTLYLCRKHLPSIISAYFFYLTNKYSYSKQVQRFYRER